MKRTDTCCSMFQLMKIMASDQIELKMSKLLEVELMLQILKKIRLILFYGNQVLVCNLAGSRLGALEDLDGILSVLQCLKRLLDCR